jgi:hypothetical protein
MDRRGRRSIGAARNSKSPEKKETDDDDPQRT